MGRRPGNPESDRSGELAEDDPGDAAEFAVDLVEQGPVRRLMRFAALAALAEQGLDPERGGSNELRRATVEIALARFAGMRPGRGDAKIHIGFGAVAEPAAHQPQRMTNAGEPADRLGIRRVRFGFGLREQVKHLPGLTGQG